MAGDPMAIREAPAHGTDGPALALEAVDVRFADGLQALSAVTLGAAAGEFVALVGPSGCGKSTVLRVLAGLQAPSRGRARSPAVDGGAETAFVFQEPTLMPWASVFDNVWLPLRLRGQSRAQAATRVREMLQGVGLAAFERALPAQLSGGMKMRASIARALVTRPAALLMDEPFAALDDLTRQRLQADLLQWWQLPKPATLFVTHNVAEAVMLSHRVVVMSPRPGRVAAEIPVPAPHPRPAGFRHDALFHATCRAVAEAMEAAA